MKDPLNGLIDFFVPPQFRCNMGVDILFLHFLHHIPGQIITFEIGTLDLVDHDCFFGLLHKSFYLLLKVLADGFLPGCKIANTVGIKT